MANHVSILCLYRTAKKKRYFKSLACEQDDRVRFEVLGYRRLPKKPRAIPAQLTAPELADLTDRIEQELFHARTFTGATTLRRALRPLLHSRIRRLHTRLVGLLSHHPADAIALWNGSKAEDHVLHAANRHFNVPIIYFENGVLPETTTVDFKGINARGSIPRDPDAYRHRPPIQVTSDPVTRRAYR